MGDRVSGDQMNCGHALQQETVIVGELRSHTGRGSIFALRETLRFAQSDKRRSGKRWIVATVLMFCGVLSARGDRIDDLVKQLGSTNDEKRADAADALTHIGGSRVEKRFREMLASSSPEKRQVAVIGLLQVSDAAEDLERAHALLKDDNSIVRWSAVTALQTSGRVEAIPWLEEVEKSDKTDSVREAATEALGKLRSSIQWLRSLPAAEKQARQLKKPILAYFFLRDSEYCQKLEEGVLADKSVIDVAEEFVCVWIDAAKQGDD